MTSPKIVHTCMDSRPELKREARDAIASDVEQFLASGGEIRQFDSSVFADPTNPACAVMRYRTRAAENSRKAGLKAMGRKAKNNDALFTESES